MGRIYSNLCILGLKGDSKSPSAEVQHLSPYVDHIIAFISSVASDDEKSDPVIACSAGLIG